MLVEVLLGVLAIGIAIGAYAIFAPRKPVGVTVVPDPVAVPAMTDAERCDHLFALGALDGADATAQLTSALDDESETVALAAAHALASSGRIEAVRAYAAAHPGDRAVELLATIGLLREI